MRHRCQIKTQKSKPIPYNQNWSKTKSKKTRRHFRKANTEPGGRRHSKRINIVIAVVTERSETRLLLRPYTIEINQIQKKKKKQESIYTNNRKAKRQYKIENT